MISPKVWTRALLVLLAIGLVIFVIAGWNSLWDRLPWSDASRRERAEASRDIAKSEAASAQLEAKGAAEQLERVETYHSRVEVIRDLTRDAQEQARSAPDATQPLDPVRASRLRTADDGLCHNAPAICSPSPAPAS